MISDTDQELDLNPYDSEGRTVWFRPAGPFEVDGVLYDPSEVGHVSRLIVSFTGVPLCSCSYSCGNRCLFDINADRYTELGDSLGDAYRWRPDVVYYRSTEFDTPVYGG